MASMVHLRGGVGPAPDAFKGRCSGCRLGCSAVHAGRGSVRHLRDGSDRPGTTMAAPRGPLSPRLMRAWDEIPRRLRAAPTGGTHRPLPRLDPATSGSAPVQPEGTEAYPAERGASTLVLVLVCEDTPCAWLASLVTVHL